MEQKPVNLYNKPLYAGLFLSGAELIITAITLYFYVAEPFDRAMNSLFRGVAFMIDMINIFWGFVIMLVIFTVGLIIHNLACGAARSDKPKLAKAMEIYSIISVAFSILLGVWFTLQILTSFDAI